MPQRYRSALLVGPPGAGKGTQGELLGALPQFFHHSSGDVFRNLSPETPEGKTFFDYSTKGLLVPDDVTIAVWKANIESQREEGHFNPDEHMLLLDGIPRTAAQAPLMDEHVEIVRVVHLVCRDEDAFVERLKKRAKEKGRSDDAQEDVIRKRFEVYKDETRPVLDHYDKGIIVDIDAMGSIEDVHARCKEALETAR